MNTCVSCRMTIRGLAISVVLSALALLTGMEAAGGERQFLVTLATSPKEYNLPCNTDYDDEAVPYDTWCPDRPYEYECTVPATFDRVPRGICVTFCDSDEDCEQVSEVEDTTFVCSHLTRWCVPVYPSPEAVRKQYFDKTDPSIGSFAEYWEEISYGDVTISGKVTDWIYLPWRINPMVADDFPEIPAGTGGDLVLEPFVNSLDMVPLDIDGDPRGVDNGATEPPGYMPGGGDTVWMPGERFVDMDDDGRWDGLDEVMNRMDWDGDNQPDLRGPWVDLNEDGAGENPDGCRYLPDDDNDGNPNCCPDGPGEPGCEPYPADGFCPGTTWEGPGDVGIIDCNGNLIPDACDIDCDSGACRATGWLQSHPDVCACDPGCGSKDELPHVENSRDACGPVVDPQPIGNTDGVTRNGIPDECEFIDADRGCADQDAVETEGSLCYGYMGSTFCTPLVLRLDNRCEFHDVNNNGILDIVEPFENFLRRWDGFTWVPVTDTYIRQHYPGDPQKVIDRKGSRPIYGSHDPYNLIPGGGCTCPGGIDCTFDLLCPAGEHSQYDSPDYWVDTGSSKMQVLALGVETTPEPSWYQRWWWDRYGTIPPTWNTTVPRVVDFVPGQLDVNEGNRIIRRYFDPDRGGTNGEGVGWIGCDDAIDRFVEFEVFGTTISPFEEACNHRILPEERDGLGVPLIMYDGLLPEFEDLPSSKYHQSGDGRLGEVTSPFRASIWGEDLGDGTTGGGNPDGLITAAGPYATHVHGNLGYDAGNVLSLELLTSSDANLDGLVDQGVVVGRPGAEDYITYGRQRLMEDCIGILDDVIDFDDFVDAVTLDRLGGGDQFLEEIPSRYQIGDPDQDVISPSGICSGIVLLPENIHTKARASGRCSYHSFGPGLFPIHNEDGLNDPLYADSTFPRTSPEFSWNIFFHDLVRGIDVPSCSMTIPSENYQTAYAAHQWLHTWEDFADMYDYDVFQAGALENCPIGDWDIMADGGLVHPAPIMKERPGTQWVVPIDLGAVLTPGVDAVLTLPPAEFVRDNSYFYLENEDRPGERYYFWSAGSGFDERMPGDGMLIMHTDVTPSCETDADCESVPCVNGFCDGEVSNPDAPPPQQRTGTRPTYVIVQADGDGELEACIDRGDAGDPWPGNTGATEFNYNTVPAATWYTQNSWIGLDILDIVPDDSGSIQVTMNWVPTGIPSLRFIDPPGGESVGTTYQVRFEATDVYGGTTIRLYYIQDEKVCSGNGDPCSKNGDCPDDEFCKYEALIDPGETNFVGQMKKSTPGTNALSINWDIGSIPDGRYVLFAKLIPGQGADNPERRSTDPRPGRNNVGTGAMAVNYVNIDGNASRSETWTVSCVDAASQRWAVHSSLSQPEINEDDPASDPYPRAATGQSYTSPGGEVRFTITASDECLTQHKGCFGFGDAFTFTTTGITAVSRAATIINGQINEDPTAVIAASPLAGDPPLRVTFDGRGSIDPNGESVTYLWNFGDGSAPVNGAQPVHVFQNAGTFTVVLRVTNPRTGRFGEAAVDIEVTNNSPNAVITAMPISGPAPLDVQFSAAQSGDTETPSDQLVYYWDYGDGETANNSLEPGTGFQSVTHLYLAEEDGTLCTEESTCTFVATLTVIDEGGKQDTATIAILAGNTNPKAVITNTFLDGPDPWEVVFNAASSFDQDEDPLTVEWIWGDGTPNEILPLTGAAGATDGSVPHTYVLPSGETSGTFATLARVRDDRGGLTTWGPVSIVVSEATVGSSDPRAIFTIDPAEPELDEEFTVDGSLSFDRPTGGTITSYLWDWDDQTSTSTGITAKHTFTSAGTYTITLTVADAEDPPNTNSTAKTVIISGDGTGEDPDEENRPPTAVFTVNPTSGYAGATVFTFDASRSTDPDGDDTKLSFRWLFGDGRTGTGPVVTHVYDEPNADGYVVRLTVRDEENASRNATQEIVVADNSGNLPPRAYIATGPRTGTAPVTITFDGRNSYDPNGDPLEFRWEFMLNGEIEDVLVGPMVNKLFTEPGDYTVELEVSDARGGVNRTEPVTILVIARSLGPDDDDDDGPSDPDAPQDIPDSADQRPGGLLCGFGMIMGLFGSFMGILAMMATRRRRIP